MRDDGDDDDVAHEVWARLTSAFGLFCRSRGQRAVGIGQRAETGKKVTRLSPRHSSNPRELAHQPQVYGDDVRAESGVRC
jgi:hypothetical protein